MVETGTQNMGLGVLPTRTVVFHGDSPLEKLVTVKLNAKFFLHFFVKGAVVEFRKIIKYDKKICWQKMKNNSLIQLEFNSFFE